MRTKSLAIIAPLLVTFSVPLSAVQAQETLAGVGAASGMGAALGGAASGVGSRARGSAQGMGGAANPGLPDDGAGGDMKPDGPSFGGTVTTTTTQTTVTRVSTPLAGPRMGGQILGQLLGSSSRLSPTVTRARRSPRAQAAYSSRVARLSPTGRKRLVLGKYRIAPRGYLASYLPQDRYKFAKAWKYVSTETDNFYYRPQDMAARGFNPNRVIGFRTWQDAMLAGYRPDPRSKPEPGNQISYLATLTRDEPLTQYVEYIYSGQVSPASVTNTFNYVRRVKSVIDRNPQARKYQRQTVNSILMASLTGDASLIPRQLGAPPVAAIAGPGGDGAMGGRGMMGGGVVGGENQAATSMGSTPGFPPSGASMPTPDAGGKEAMGSKGGLKRPGGM